MMRSSYKRFLSVFNDPVVDPPPVVPPPAPKTFTQDQLNAALAEDRRKEGAKTQKLISDLNALKEQAGLTQQQRDELQVKIDELSVTFQTKEQQLTEGQKRLQKKYDDDTKKISTERDSWKERYASEKHVVSITTAAGTDAFNPAQIVSLLSPMATLVEDKNGEGQVTGYSTKIKWTETDDKGVAQNLLLTPVEVVARMKEKPNQYGNLFKSGVAGGVGGTTGNPSNSDPNSFDFTKGTPEQYAEWRKKQKFPNS